MHRRPQTQKVPGKDQLFLSWLVSIYKHRCPAARVPAVVVVVQSLSRVQLFVTLWTAEHQASLSFTISQSLLKLTSIELMMPSNHLIFCRPLLLLPLIFPSIRVSPNESDFCIRWPKSWSFRFSISLLNQYLELISCEVKSFSHVRLFATPWTVAYQDPQSMGFSRQEYWSGLPFPSPGDLPNPGIEPGSPTL